MMDPAFSLPFSCPNMLEATQRLHVECISYKLTSEVQIKIGPYNFYPAKGTIFLDGAKKANEERGLDSFIEIACRLRDRNPSRFRDYGLAMHRRR